MFKYGKKKLIEYKIILIVIVAISFLLDQYWEGYGLWLFIFLAVLFLLYETYLHYFRLNQTSNRLAWENEKSSEAWHSIHSFLKFKYPLQQISSYAAAPDFAQYLMQYIMKNKPAVVCELGCGFSTMIMAKTAEMYSGRTKIISFEADEKYLNSCHHDIEAQGLNSYVQLIHAPYENLKLKNDAKKYYSLSAINEKIDLLIIDGPPKNLDKYSRHPAVELFKDHLAPGGIMIADDASRDDMKETIEMWKRENPEFEFQVVPLTRGACIISRKN